MSAPSTLVFIGVRYQIDDDEIEELEERTHSHQKAARNASLDHYWDNFGEPGERYYSFLGKRLGVVGLENEAEISIACDDLARIQREIQEKLRSVGYNEPPLLFVQLIPDT